MPVLPNPRHEAFAQHFFAGLSNGITQEKAYRAAGYLVTNRNSADACASRLMLRIAKRVSELQAEALERQQPQIDISRDRIGKRLDLASKMAEKQQNPNGITASELGIAKVFGLMNEDIQAKAQDITTANTMQDIGRKLLQSIGFKEPDDVSIQAAIEANDAFIERLEAIRNRAQGLTIDQDGGASCITRRSQWTSRLKLLLLLGSGLCCPSSPCRSLGCWGF
jgi:hypothetical protein